MQPTKRLRVLVTGATGFLGGNVVQNLAARDDVELVAACRRPENLQASFEGEKKCGDLLDPSYRASVVKNVDVVCHTGTWASLWGHAALERTHFLEPTLDLIEQSIRHGVRRFLMTSTVAIAAPSTDGAALSDFATPRYTGFWPHVDRLIDVDRYMRENSNRGTQMITMRLGHFVGAGNRLGLLPALLPRLGTRLVPWIAGGRTRLPLVTDADLAEAYALAASAEGLDDYESFNISGAESPPMRELLELTADEARLAKPWFSVPTWAGYGFGGLIELLHPVLPGRSPFLTRSIVYLAEDRPCENENARKKLGYRPKKDWRVGVREAVTALKAENPWPRFVSS